MSTGCSPAATHVVDHDLILRKLVNLDTYLAQLTPYRALDPVAYSTDWQTQRIVERTLHLAIETCMDVADHIVADRALTVPDTAAATFESLGEAESCRPRSPPHWPAWWASGISSSTTTRGSIRPSSCECFGQTCRTSNAFATRSSTC